MNEIVNRLREPMLSDDRMRGWDAMRKYIAEGGKASWPRDNLESWLDAADQDRTEAAAYIERLEAEFGFLLDRLGDFETQIESDADALEFDAHVRPAIARARAALQTGGRRG